MASSSSRASSGVSTGVLPFLMTYFGPRTAAAGLKGISPPVTIQSNSIRIAARCCLTLGFAMPSASSLLYICRNSDGLDVIEADAMLLAPGEERAARPAIG